ncbi:hypothetical protein BJ912DRAFT_945543 [Pholiota molesta]|nr:hypothetical protein BJ912DRAFT_945543 [Pholiota molesta]
MSLVNQAIPSVTDSQKTTRWEPAPVANSIKQAETSTSNSQFIMGKLSPDLSLVPNSSSMPKVMVPPIFKILAEILKIEKAKGYSRPLRSFVADTMYKKGFTYKNTGTNNFSQYTALGETCGVIELGGLEALAWISLKPEYDNTSKPATPVVPLVFKSLVQTLKLQQSKGFPRPSRAVIAYMMYKSGFVYKDAGVNNFSQYAALAEKQGIVELGGNEGDGSISLTPEYRDVPMSQTN